MKKKLFKLGGLALALTFGLVLFGCGDDDSGGGETFPAAKGKITINGIPATHNGKYILLSGTVGGKLLLGLTDITGYPSDIAYKMVKIANGKAEVPLYTANPSATSYSDSFLAYDGNDTLSSSSLLGIYIISHENGSLKQTDATSAMTGAAATKTLSSGTFSSGNLTVNW